MNKRKKLNKLFNEMELPQYAIDQLFEKQSDMKTAFLRMCKPPHSKKHESPYDTKKKYGLLYTTFNNLKKKYKLSNYNVRQEFIGWFINNDEFKTLFKEYKRSGFCLNYKPSFIMIDETLEQPIVESNIKLVLYENLMEHAHRKQSKEVTQFDSVGKVYRIYPSINKAAEESKRTSVTIAYHLKKGPNEGKFRHTTDKHREYVKKRNEELAQMKVKDMV